MRKQLEVDIKGNLNRDLADTVKALLEGYNSLVDDYNALVAQLEADKADISSTDFAALASTADVDID